MASPIWFAVVSQGRSGSTLLCNALGLRPDVFMWDEILHPMTKSKLPHEDGRRRVLAAYHRANADAVGVHLHVTQPSLELPQWESGWRVLEETPDLKVIVLSRLDALAQLASYKIAKASGLWADQSALAERPTVHVDRDELAWFTAVQRQLLNARIAAIGGSRRYEIHYEDLIANWPDRSREIITFLGLPAFPALTMPLKKQETRPLWEVVSNYHELCGGSNG